MLLSSQRTALPELIEQAARVIRGGGIAIFPTDTVYGIGCDPASEASVERIFAAKRRPVTKPLSLHFATVEEMLAYTDANPLASAAARAFLPGALTLIVRRPATVAAYVTRGLDTVGLRVPAHPLCAAILAASGPVAATSANISGSPAFTGRESVTDLPEADVMVDDGPTRLGAESTIIDVTGTRPRIVREGAITRGMLEEQLGPIEGTL